MVLPAESACQLLSYAYKSTEGVGGFMILETGSLSLQINVKASISLQTEVASK